MTIFVICEEMIFMQFGVNIMKGMMRLLALQPLKLHYLWGKSLLG